MDQSRREGERVLDSVLDNRTTTSVLEVRASAPLSSGGRKPYVVSLSYPFINAAEQTPSASTFFVKHALKQLNMFKLP